MSSYVANIAVNNFVPCMVGCAAGYVATRTIEWMYRDVRLENRNLVDYLFPLFQQHALSPPSKVTIDLITIQKISADQSYQLSIESELSPAALLHRVSYRELNRLRESVGWLTRTEKIWNKVIPNSSYIVCIVKKDEKTHRKELIAHGFLMGNGRMATIVDVAVHPKYQRRKVGTLVMNQIILHIQAMGQDYATINLSANENNKTFYAKFGFKEQFHSMERWGEELHMNDSSDITLPP